jgi:prolyl oligopeptidase
MRRLGSLFTLLLIAACATQTAPTTQRVSVAKPPATEARPVTETMHGVAITDPYRWLEDQQSPETRAWIEKENAYTDSVINQLPQKERFAKRIEQLLTNDVMTAPLQRGGRYFFAKRKAGEDLFSLYMRESLSGPDILLVDPAPLSAKHTTSVSLGSVSGDGKTIAYYIRDGGADEVEVHWLDVDSKKDVGTPLPRARYFGTSLTPDGRTVYFTRYLGATQRVYRRAVSGGDEQPLFGEGYGAGQIVGSGISDDGRWLLIDVSYGSAAKKTELYIKDLATDGPIKTIVNDLDVRSSADVAGDKLVIETNWNAPNERLMVVDVANPGRENWKELVPENKSAALQGYSLAGGKVFASYLENVKPRIVAYTLDGRQAGELHFDTIGSLSGIGGDWSSPVAFYRYNSFGLPPTIYSYNVNTGESSVFFKQNVPVNSDDFTVEQVWYPSKDGTKIPMFLAYKKGLQKNSSNPTLLTGYGGFNSSQLPGFSSTYVAWMENGGLVALPNLRGGGEFGESWHRAGMLEQKQNVFDDFISAAQWLIDNKYTSPQHLGISGGSNGGLLVTAFTTQRPDLVKAVVVSYPLIDMLRYQKFLVASFWVPEYGSADDAEQFKYIYAYSPYQRVKQGTKYPAMLFITGDADTRVAPLHARKMAALMQSLGSDNPVMIRYHVSGGHSGGEPLKVQVNNAAETLAFLDWQLR